MNIGEMTQILESILHPERYYQSLAKDYSNPKNFKPEICKECGGECCQRCGCEFSPDDFKEISFDFLRQEIEKGYISIDYIDRDLIYSDFGGYILRIRNQDRPIVDTGYLGRKPCILWKKEGGCKLDDNNRPSGGKLMEPSRKIDPITREHECPTTYSTRRCVYEWKRYQHILLQLKDYFQDKDFPCSL